MSTSDENDRSYSRTRPSCIQCQRLKKKCDRKRPQCSLCLRRRQSCSFSVMSSSSSSTMTPSAGSSNPSTPTSRDINSNFPAVFFLDSFLFKRSMNRLPDVGFNLEPAVLEFAGNIPTDQVLLSNYFARIHPWIPCLSRKHFMERVINPLSSAQPGNTLLIAAIKLVTIPPSDSDPRSSVYTSIKSDLARAVVYGLFELRVFQALLLLALYELGHGILPAAYMTVGSCIRYGNALRFNTVVEYSANESLNDIESEERRRSWWTALLLDRFLNLGRAEKPSLVEDPSSNAILPADDSLWENAEQQYFPLHRLSDPPTSTMGRFCLTAQAVILLGKVFRNINDESGQDEARVLDNTIAALTNVSLQEGHIYGRGVCSPTTICYSARLLLHDVERAAVQKPDIATRGRGNAQDMESDIAASMLRVARGVLSTGRCGAEEISPFCLDAMYRSGMFYARQFRNIRDQSDSEALEVIKNALAVMNDRWRVAGAYLKMLEAREFSGIL